MLSRVLRIAETLQAEWAHEMEGIDIHCFRMTHRTWAKAANVQPGAIDKQLGHAEAKEQQNDLERYLAGSKTGRRFYTDRNSPLFEAVRSAEAVRGILDAALADVGPVATPLATPPSKARSRA